MFVSLGDARALEHPGRPLCETALARLRNIAAILLHDAESRTITALQTSAIVSLSVPVRRSAASLKLMIVTIPQLAQFFSVTLYIQSRYNGREIGREKSGPERFIDYDARRKPRTKRFCVKCQKDLDPAKLVRRVYVTLTWKLSTPMILALPAL